MSDVGTYIRNLIKFEEHGGGCCGRHHLYELGYFGPRVEAVQRIQELMGSIYTEHDYDDYDDDEGCRTVYYEELCLEITLTGEQADSKPSTLYLGWPSKAVEVLEHDPYKDKTWHQVLTEVLGFSCVYKFTNPNTGNEVRVYLKSTAGGVA